MKNQIIKGAVILFILQILQISVLLAQSHEFSVYGGGGLSTLRYQLSVGDASVGYGGDFGVGYTYFLNDQWGIHTGAGLGLYNAKAKLDGIQTVTPNLTDSDGERFDLHTTLAGFIETQKAMFLNIPVMVVYEQGFYVMGGLKIGVPLNGKYTSKSETLTHAGYYPLRNNWATTQEFAGYGTFAGKNFDGRFDLGMSLMLSLEGGMKWSIGNNLLLCAGAYIDYGLNNSAKSSNLPFITYNAAHASDFSANSVLSTFADKINMMAAGIKLRLVYGNKKGSSYSGRQR